MPDDAALSENGSESSAQEDNLVTHDEVAALAYELWQERSGEGGSPEQDWFEAERRLRLARMHRAAVAG